MRSSNPVIDVLVDAITASGKKIEQIDKKAIFGYLEKSGISRGSFESIYQELLGVYNKPKNSSKEKKTNITVVDYNDSSHNDVKVREPRKSVFSEIKKIAG